MTSRTLRLLPSPYALENLYNRLGCPAWYWPAVGGVLFGLLVLGSSVADDARADLVPDAVEVPLMTRHLAHNDRLSNTTPGVVLQWDTPLAFAGTHAVRAHAAAFRNSNGDPTVYGGLHAEWRISGPLFAGGGLGLTYGYKDLDYGGNAWLDGVPFSVGAVTGRRYEKRQFKPAAQLDARLELNPTYSLTLHLITDEKRCKRQPAGLHVTSCAVVLGIRGAW